MISAYKLTRKCKYVTSQMREHGLWLALPCWLLLETFLESSGTPVLPCEGDSFSTRKLPDGIIFNITDQFFRGWNPTVWPAELQMLLKPDDLVPVCQWLLDIAADQGPSCQRLQGGELCPCVERNGTITAHVLKPDLTVTEWGLTLSTANGTTTLCQSHPLTLTNPPGLESTTDSVEVSTPGLTFTENKSGGSISLALRIAVPLAAAVVCLAFILWVVQKRGHCLPRVSARFVPEQPPSFHTDGHSVDLRLLDDLLKPARKGGSGGKPPQIQAHFYRRTGSGSYGVDPINSDPPIVL